MTERGPAGRTPAPPLPSAAPPLGQGRAPDPARAASGDTGGPVLRRLTPEEVGALAEARGHLEATARLLDALDRRTCQLHHTLPLPPEPIPTLVAESETGFQHYPTVELEADLQFLHEDLRQVAGSFEEVLARVPGPAGGGPGVPGRLRTYALLLQTGAQELDALPGLSGGGAPRLPGQLRRWAATLATLATELEATGSGKPATTRAGRRREGEGEGGEEDEEEGGAGGPPRLQGPPGGGDGSGEDPARILAAVGALLQTLARVLDALAASCEHLAGRLPLLPEPRLSQLLDEPGILDRHPLLAALSDLDCLAHDLRRLARRAWEAGGRATAAGGS